MCLTSSPKRSIYARHGAANLDRRNQHFVVLPFSISWSFKLQSYTNREVKVLLLASMPSTFPSTKRFMPHSPERSTRSAIQSIDASGAGWHLSAWPKFRRHVIHWEVFLFPFHPCVHTTVAIQLQIMFVLIHRMKSFVCKLHHSHHRIVHSTDSL